MDDRILVAVDINEQDIAQPALDAALELARASGGSLRLIHVRQPIPAAALEFVPAEMSGSQEKYSMQQLTALANKVPLDTSKVSAVSRSGSVYVEVLAEAKKWQANTIVVSAHQPTAATYLLGSNATKIVRHAQCSVMVARSAKKASLFG